MVFSRTRLESESGVVEEKYERKVASLRLELYEDTKAESKQCSGGQ